MTEEEIMALLTAAAEMVENANQEVATITAERDALAGRLTIAEEVAQRLPLMEEECNQLLADKTDLTRQLGDMTAERDALAEELRSLRESPETAIPLGEETVKGETDVDDDQGTPEAIA